MLPQTNAMTKRRVIVSTIGNPIRSIMYVAGGWVQITGTMVAGAGMIVAMTTSGPPTGGSTDTTASS